MNEQLLQQCVDGELTPIEQRRFLASLNEGDAAWKQLACRLLEDRVLAAACRDWMDDAVPVGDSLTPTMSDAASQNGYTSVRETRRSSLVGIRLETNIENRSEKHRLADRFRWIVPACVALTGVLLGVWLGLQWPRGISRELPVGGNVLAHAPEFPGTSNSTGLGDDAEVPTASAFNTIQLTINTPDGPQVIELPIVGANDLQRLVSMQSTISPEVREQLSRQGIQLNESPGVITLPIDDAHHVVVPVQAVQMRHVGL